MKKYYLEIACFNAEAATIAQENGADRIELCSDYSAGGITPPSRLIEQVRKETHLPLFIMIRPRPGNFIYSEEEFEIMKRSIIEAKKMQVDGFVFGILKEDKSVDTIRNAELVKLASPLSSTFHRAFDVVPDPFFAMEQLIESGFRTILSSGQAATAEEGAILLKCLVEDAKNRIVIMPGGSIRSKKIADLKKSTNALFYHTSAIINNTDVPDAKEIRILKEKLC
jgi:copper homeostasis protein